jgi:hypothetical protein
MGVVEPQARELREPLEVRESCVGYLRSSEEQAIKLTHALKMR